MGYHNHQTCSCVNGAMSNWEIPIALRLVGCICLGGEMPVKPVDSGTTCGVLVVNKTV
jgi:hypothetical protein